VEILRDSMTLSLRERGELKDLWLAKRFETLLPALMRETGIDMWIVTSQESNDDPVLRTLLPSPLPGSGRRTMLLFFLKPDGELERLSIYRPGSALNKFYRGVWLNDKNGNWGQFTALSPEKNMPQGNTGMPETQMECLARIINERQPKKIGLNFSTVSAFGDGISHGTYSLIETGIGKENAAKIVSAHELCVRWLETRIPEEIDAYAGIVTLAKTLMDEAFSTRFIHPGLTSAADLEWALMQRAFDLGLRPWFPFMVALRRFGARGLSGDTLIQHGDLIHLDLGVEYLGFCSDLQDNGYVLKRGETKAPSGLEALFRKGRRLQDLLAEEFRPLRKGNEILASVLGRAGEEGIEAMIYTHPLGYYGHSAGMTVGMADNQNFIPGTGEHPLYDNTVYAMELNVAAPVDEWGGQKTMMGMETDIVFCQGQVEYFYRQAQLRLVA
jgi:Xaa-Pro aminopeptidase